MQGQTVTHVNRARELLRSIAMSALFAAATDDPERSAIIWNTAGSGLAWPTTKRIWGKRWDSRVHSTDDETGLLNSNQRPLQTGNQNRHLGRIERTLQLPNDFVGMSVVRSKATLRLCK